MTNSHVHYVLLYYYHTIIIYVLSHLSLVLKNMAGLSFPLPIKLELNCVYQIRCSFTGSSPESCSMF